MKINQVLIAGFLIVALMLVAVGSVSYVLGNEVEGVSDEVVELADFAVEIPMFGVKQSLNVAVAFGVVLFHLIECLKGK